MCIYVVYLKGRGEKGRRGEGRGGWVCGGDPVTAPSISRAWEQEVEPGSRHSWMGRLCPQWGS